MKSRRKLRAQRNRMVNRASRRNIYVKGWTQSIPRMLRAGVIMSAGPLVFDICASIYAGRIGIYAPFLYPMFFALGVGFVIDDVLKARRAAKQ